MINGRQLSDFDFDRPFRRFEAREIYVEHMLHNNPCSQMTQLGFIILTGLEAVHVSRQVEITINLWNEMNNYNI